MTDLVSVTPWPSKYRGVGVTTLETEGRIAVEDPKETGARERSDPGGMASKKKERTQHDRDDARMEFSGMESSN
jgi:hypothetical protein